jgi:hypothetical protein
MANIALSDYTEAKLINHLFRTDSWTKTSTLYFALLTATPSDTGGGTEVSGGNYARVSVTPSDSNFTVTDNVVTNATTITFPTPNAAWGTVTHIGIYDAATSGNLLLWADLVAAKSIGATDTAPFFDVGSFVCTYNSTSTALATQVLSFIFKTLATWTKPTTLYFNFYTVAPTEAGGGTLATGGSYAAVAVTPSNANFTLTVNGSNGTSVITNASDLTFPAPTAAWGSVVSLGVSTNASLYVCHADFPARTINSGDAAPIIQASAFTWSIN